MELLRIPDRLPVRILAPHQAVRNLAAFLRERLAEVGRWGRPEPAAPAEVATVVVAAAAPFAPTSFARARLLRQLHASGLLTRAESEQVQGLFELVQ